MDIELKLRTSKRIKDLRLKNHYTMEKLADMIGVSKSTIAKWENGYIDNMRQDNIMKLAEVFSVSPTYIMGYMESTDEMREDEFVKLYKQLNKDQKDLVDNMLIALSEKK